MTEPTTTTKTVDASLSLLHRLVEDAMDPGYREAQQHRDAQSTGWRSSILVSVVLGLLAILVVAAVMQVRAGAPADSKTRAELVDRATVATAALQDVDSRVDSLSTRVQKVREEALTGSDSDQALADEVNALEANVGGQAVSGPGLQVTLTDGPPTEAGQNGPDLARVLDTDIQLAVNGMFAAGADAVSVNDQRVTVLSPIRSAGEAVLVGFRPLTPPYVLKAVGTDALAPAFEQGNARQELAGLEAAYGIGVEVARQDDVTIPARPDLQVRYAREVGSPSAGTSEQEYSP
ncbi:MAG: DUF881 domain-containing protein [Actinomycetes bacterium]